jgi:type IV pilus assembly protein PilM
MFPFAPRNLIGIDLGTFFIKVVKLGAKRGSFGLEAAACMKVSPAEEEGPGPKEVLGEILRIQKIHGRRAATAIGSPFLTNIQLELPQMPRKDLKEAVRWEVRKEVKVSSDELVSDYVISEERTGAGNKLSLIAFAAKKSEIDRMEGIFKDVSLELRVVDALPAVLLAAFDANNEWEKGVNYAMLDIGGSQSTLAVFKDRRLKFVRVIPLGGHDLTLALVNSLGKSEREAEADKITFGLAEPAAPSEPQYAEPQHEIREADEGDWVKGIHKESMEYFTTSLFEQMVGEQVRGILKGSMEGLGTEVIRSFDYYQAKFREGPISKLFLCGGTAALKGIDEYLTNLLGVACFVDDPLRNVNIPRGFDRDGLKAIAPFLTVATGLATRRDTL